MEETIKKINEVFDTLRPYLNADGGNIEFIKYEDKTVFVKLSGACSYCAFQDNTLQDSILRSLQEVVPEVEAVINVEI